MTVVNELLDTIIPMAISGGGGIIVVAIGVWVSKWRNRRMAAKIGGSILHEPPRYLHGSYPSSPMAGVKSHRQ